MKISKLIKISKVITNFIIDENFQVFLEKEKHVIDQWTNRRTNQQTDPQTDPLIEMQKLFFFMFLMTYLKKNLQFWNLKKRTDR